MNPNEEDLLKKTYELSQENNKILKGIRSSNRWSTLFKVFYWVIIIGIAVGAFYYVQPYIDIATKTYKSIQGDLTKVKSVVNSIPTNN
jgi:hypothetical protein